MTTSIPIIIKVALLLFLKTTDGFTSPPDVLSKKTTLLATSPDASSSTTTTTTEVIRTKNNETSSNTVFVAFTREKGKNAKLREKLLDNPAIQKKGIDLDIIEIPAIEHADGDDKQKLIDLLSDAEEFGNSFDCVVITSPEAARVLASAIDEVASITSATILESFLNDNKITLAAVGKATSKELERLGFKVGFVPSQANGETLAAELPPKAEGVVTKVLYPASAKARNDIQEGLDAREDATFQLQRLNTYDTIPATFTKEQLATIDQIEIACFGSPSAVKAWLQNIDIKEGYQDLDEEEKKRLGPHGNGNVVAACIGTTSAKACLESGRWNATDIYYPKENPGVDSWAATIAQASGDVYERKFWS